MARVVFPEQSVLGHLRREGIVGELSWIPQFQRMYIRQDGKFIPRGWMVTVAVWKESDDNIVRDTGHLRLAILDEDISAYDYKLKKERYG